MPILAARSSIQRRPRRRVFAPPLGAPTVSLLATGQLQTAVQASPAGKVPVQAAQATQTKAFPAVAGRVPLTAHGETLEKLSVGPGKWVAGLSALSLDLLKASGTPSGKVPLLARETGMVKDRLSAPGTAAPVNLTATGALMAALRAAPTLRATLTATAETKTAVVAQPAGKTALLARTATQAKPRAPLLPAALLVARAATGTKAKFGPQSAFLQATRTAQVQAHANQTGKMALAARSTMQLHTLAREGAGQFIGLVATARLRVQGLGLIAAIQNPALTAFYQRYTADAGPGASTSFWKTGQTNPGDPSGPAETSFFRQTNAGSGTAPAKSSFFKGT